MSGPVTKEHIETSRELGKALYQLLLPVIRDWIEEEIKRGTHENAIMISVTTESLVMAGRAYAGGEDLFMRMARRALHVTQEKVVVH